MKVFLFDANKCNGCYNCQFACKDEHCGNEWLPYAKPQPITGHFWMRVDEKVHGQVPKVNVEYRPVLCQHCDDCKLLEQFPDAAYRRDDGLVILDPEKATDPAMVDACPHGAIYWNDHLSIAQKCTGCAHLVDQGELPHCVDLCVLGALQFGEEEDFADQIAQAETIDGSKGAGGTRVYYLNMPHLFIGGEVWDPETDEIIEGATIKLSGSAEAETRSDEYGDFWFKRIDAGQYHVEIAADGYQGVAVDVDLKESTNLGDFPLKRA